MSPQSTGFARTRTPAGPLPAGARALLVGALGLLAARVLALFVPGRWLWGLDLGRDLAPATFAVPLALTLALCVPAVARAIASRVPSGPRALRAFAFALAVALAGFAWTHPDHALYTGDASLRHGVFAQLEHPEGLAAQASRGDLLLHHTLPRWVATHTPWSAEQTGRAEGALLALLTALAAWRLARTSGAQGAVALGVMAMAACTGALALDNGYGKSIVEVACLTTVIAAGAVGCLRDGGGLGLVGVSVGVALLLHRSALALIPVWALCAWLAVRAGTWRKPAACAGLAAPVLALAFAGAKLVQIVRTFDTQKHLHGGSFVAMVRAAVTPGHLLDVLHTLCLLVPLTPLVPLLLWLRPRLGPREALVFAALVLPPMALLFLVIPQHGLARDWDVFAFAGSALAALVAWRVARLLLGMPRAGWLALPLALVAVVPALQWAALQSDSERAWARAEAILLGPPARDLSERADGLSTIGMMHFGRGQYAPARRLFERGTEAAPNPRLFVEWGMAETMLGHPDSAMAQYWHAVTLNPNLVVGWHGVAAAASALGDRARMEEAVRNLERTDPGSQTLRDARAWLEANRVQR